MTGLKIGLIGTAVSAAYLPVADVSIPTSPDALAGKDANYILAAIAIVLAFSLWQVCKLYIQSQKAIYEQNARSVEALTKVADALNSNTAVINECHRRTVKP